MRNIIFALKPLHTNIAKMTINGETAGFIVMPEKDCEKPFTISHNGKSLGAQHCEACAFASIARHYERIPAGEEVALIGQQLIRKIDIEVTSVTH